MQGAAPNTSDESVQIVRVVKPSETLENAFNVLPEDDSSNAKGRNGTITINNTVVLNNVSNKVDIFILKVLPVLLIYTLNLK